MPTRSRSSTAPIGSFPSFASLGYAAHFGWFPVGGIWIFFMLFVLLGQWGGGLGTMGWPARLIRARAVAPGDEAFQILRYARGELTKDQYDAMMRDLGRGTDDPRTPG